MMHRRRLLLVLGVLAVVLLFVRAGAPPRGTPLVPDELRARVSYAVVEVVDGDTIKVSVAGQVEAVRLIGVDTPETVHPTQPVEAFGREASACTKSLLDGQKVWLEYDGPEPARDRYGRLLAYVYRVPDGVLVNLEIIRAGYGEAYVQYPFRFMELFRAVEREARAASRGLWASGGAEAEQAGPTVYITQTGERYHRAGCRYLRNGGLPVSLAEGQRRGLTRCGTCKP